MCFVPFQPCKRIRGKWRFPLTTRQYVTMCEYEKKTWNYRWEILEKFNLNNTKLKWKERGKRRMIENWQISHSEIFYQKLKILSTVARSINSAFLDMSLEFICCIQVNCILTLCREIAEKEQIHLQWIFEFSSCHWFTIEKMSHVNHLSIINRDRPEWSESNIQAPVEIFVSARK